MPIKKSKGKELSEIQKKENRKISSFRILVEHVIGGIKKCRNFDFDDLVMPIACGLHNFRMLLKMCFIFKTLVCILMLNKGR